MAIRLGLSTLQRLQIVDAAGPWLDGTDLALSWRPSELFGRRVHIQALSAAALRVLRAPQVPPQPPPKGGPPRLPVAIQVDRIRLRLETLPAISVRRGAWDLAGGFALERNLSATGRLAARSRLHAGDGLDADFRLGEHGRIVLNADATEGSGGALAGLLGLPADQRLSLQARANGTAEAGTLQVHAASGAGQPLAADADWSNGSTRLQARLDLDASRLTSFLAARAGRQAVLTATARHLQGNSFQVRAALTAQAASLTLDGPLDWRAQRSGGLGVRLQVADLSRWVPGLTLGATSTAGALSGDVGRFTYKGVLDAHRFARSGYVVGPHLRPGGDRPARRRLGPEGGPVRRRRGRAGGRVRPAGPRAPRPAGRRAPGGRAAAGAPARRPGCGPEAVGARRPGPAGRAVVQGFGPALQPVGRPAQGPRRGQRRLVRKPGKG